MHTHSFVFCAEKPRSLTVDTLRCTQRNADMRSYAKQPWSRFVTPDNRANVSSDGIDLLDKLLRYNHQERLTAAEALAHSFFSTCSFVLPPDATATQC